MLTQKITLQFGLNLRASQSQLIGGCIGYIAG
jgi:hypothetical protein